MFREKGIRVLVKRDDLLCLPVEPGDRAFCGNKWRKMKYNVWEAKNKGAQTLVTFGGAFSNHVAAVAAAGGFLVSKQRRSFAENLLSL